MTGGELVRARTADGRRHSRADLLPPLAQEDLDELAGGLGRAGADRRQPRPDHPGRAGPGGGVGRRLPAAGDAHERLRDPRCRPPGGSCTCPACAVCSTVADGPFSLRHLTGDHYVLTPAESFEGLAPGAALSTRPDRGDLHPAGARDPAPLVPERGRLPAGGAGRHRHRGRGRVRGADRRRQPARGAAGQHGRRHTGRAPCPQRGRRPGRTRPAHPHPDAGDRAVGDRGPARRPATPGVPRHDRRRDAACGGSSGRTRWESTGGRRRHRDPGTHRSLRHRRRAAARRGRPPARGLPAVGDERRHRGRRLRRAGRGLGPDEPVRPAAGAGRAARHRVLRDRRRPAVRLPLPHAGHRAPLPGARVPATAAGHHGRLQEQRAAPAPDGGRRVAAGDRRAARAHLGRRPARPHPRRARPAAPAARLRPDQHHRRVGLPDAGQSTSSWCGTPTPAASR